MRVEVSIRFSSQSNSLRGHMSFEDALELLTRDESFKATLYAVNTLLIQKGIYTKNEFEDLFVEWAKKELNRKKQGHQVDHSIPVTR